MVLKVFSVYDSKAEAYMTPFFMTTKGQAIRAFTDVVNTEGKEFHKYADDYTLFEIGTYDDSTGVISSLTSKLSLGCAIEFKKADNQLPVPVNGLQPNRAERRLNA